MYTSTTYSRLRVYFDYVYPPPTHTFPFPPDFYNCYLINRGGGDIIKHSTLQEKAPVKYSYCILCTVHRGHLLTMYASAYDVLISLKCCRLNANIELYIEQNHTPNQLRHFKSQYLLNVSRLCFAHMYNCTYIDCLIITTTKCWTVVDNTVGPVFSLYKTSNN